MSDPVATAVRVMPSKGITTKAKVMAQFDDQEEKKVFDFFDDEISFRAQELVGKTEQEMVELFIKKDKAYLQS